MGGPRMYAMYADATVTGIVGWPWQELQTLFLYAMYAGHRPMYADVRGLYAAARFSVICCDLV